MTESESELFDDEMTYETNKADIVGSQRSDSSIKFVSRNAGDPRQKKSGSRSMTSSSSSSSSSSESEPDGVDALDGGRHSERYKKLLAERRKEGFCPMLNKSLKQSNKGFVATPEFLKLK